MMPPSSSDDESDDDAAVGKGQARRAGVGGRRGRAGRCLPTAHGDSASPAPRTRRLPPHLPSQNPNVGLMPPSDDDDESEGEGGKADKKAAPAPAEAEPKKSSKQLKQEAEQAAIDLARLEMVRKRRRV